MIIDMPSTTANAVARRLVELRERYGAVALGRVLTLVLVVDEQHAEAAIESANQASYESPCRTIAVVRETARGSARLDTQIRVGGDAGASEVIVQRVFGPLTAHPDSVVVPLLLSDNPLVVWWPGESPAVPAEHPLGRLAQRRITDASGCRRPAAALTDRAATYRPGDTDLAWTRLTLWRALLAAALDQPPFEPVTAVRVVGESVNPSVDLLAGWLALTLDCPVTRTKVSGAEGVLSVRLDRPSGPIILDRPGRDLATLTTPGRIDRQVALPRRTAAECLSEELRRIDPDEIYAEVLATGLERLRQTGRVSRARVRSST